MIHSLNSSGHASLSSIVFKIECQNPFVPLLGMYVGRGIVTIAVQCGLDWVKPFGTKKQHGFVYIMMF